VTRARRTALVLRHDSAIEEGASFGPLAQEASARLLGEYLEGVDARTLPTR